MEYLQVEYGRPCYGKPCRRHRKHDPNGGECWLARQRLFDIHFWIGVAQVGWVEFLWNLHRKQVERPPKITSQHLGFLKLSSSPDEQARNHADRLCLPIYLIKHVQGQVCNQPSWLLFLEKIYCVEIYHYISLVLSFCICHVNLNFDV